MERGAIVVGMYGIMEESISNKKEKSSILLKKREKEGKNEGRTKRKETQKSQPCS